MKDRRDGYTQDMFGHDEGEERKQQGMARVLSHQQEQWRESYRFHAQQFFNAMPKGAWFTGEQINAVVQARQDIEPTHPNAYSAMFSAMLRKWISEGQVILTAEMHKSMRPSRNKNACRIYQKTQVH